MTPPARNDRVRPPFVRLHGPDLDERLARLSDAIGYRALGIVWSEGLPLLVTLEPDAPPGVPA